MGVRGFLAKRYRRRCAHTNERYRGPKSASSPAILRIGKHSTTRWRTLKLAEALEKARDIEQCRLDPFELTRGISKYLQGDRAENLIVVFNNVDRCEAAAQLAAFQTVHGSWAKCAAWLGKQQPARIAIGRQFWLLPSITTCASNQEDGTSEYVVSSNKSSTAMRFGISRC